LRYRFDGLLPRPPPDGLPVRLGQFGFVGFEGFEEWAFKVRMAVLLLADRSSPASPLSWNQAPAALAMFFQNRRNGPVM